MGLWGLTPPLYQWNLWFSGGFWAQIGDESPPPRRSPPPWTNSWIRPYHLQKKTYKFGRYDVPDVFEILDLLVWVRNNTLFWIRSSFRALIKSLFSPWALTVVVSFVSSFCSFIVFFGFPAPFLSSIFFFAFLLFIFSFFISEFVLLFEPFATGFWTFLVTFFFFFFSILVTCKSQYNKKNLKDKQI